MGVFGLFTKKEVSAAVEKEVYLLNAKINELQELLVPERNDAVIVEREIAEMQDVIKSLNKDKDNLHNDMLRKKQEIDYLSSQVSKAKLDLENQLSSIKSEIFDKKKELIELDDEILYQSFGLYKPIYDFALSSLYKDALTDIRKKQKLMISNKTATHFSDNWTVNNSLTQGTKMTNNNIKQILRSFNTECENAIDRVKYNNFESMETRIRKSFETLNTLNAVVEVSISQAYLNLKLDELHLAIEYAMKKQDEKEEQRKIRDELREEAKLQKEIEEARKNIAKEKQHYKNALDKIMLQIDKELIEVQKNILLEKKAELEATLSELEVAMEKIDYRVANQKAGYVYVISNIGSFGNNVYKIGMTRRLDPTERIYELSDASVPFNFDIHAMIFTVDAPGLENSLHKAFENKKINMVNGRREFFNVTLDEIKAVVRSNYDKSVDFIDIPSAEQYRETLIMKTQLYKTAIPSVV